MTVLYRSIEISDNRVLGFASHFHNVLVMHAKPITGSGDGSDTEIKANIQVKPQGSARK